MENILVNSQKAAKLIIEGKNNVLVYCPTGTSGTPLLCCLIQLFCDPYYRTLKGFRTLIHKEWIYYMHHFLKKGYVLLEKKTENEKKNEAQTNTDKESSGGLMA